MGSPGVALWRPPGGCRVIWSVIFPNMGSARPVRSMSNLLLGLSHLKEGDTSLINCCLTYLWGYENNMNCPEGDTVLLFQ